VKKALVALPKIRDTALLARTIRDLYKDGAGSKPTAESRFLILHDGLQLAARVGEAFSIELLALVPETLRGVSISAAPDAVRGGSGGPTPIGDLAKKQGQLLERALTLAGHFDQREIAQQIVTEFVELVRSKTEDQRFEIVNVVAKESLRNLRKLGMRDEVDRILGLFQEVVLQKQDSKQLRAKYAAKPEQWARVLQTQLSLASGWLAYDLPQKALPILEEAKTEVLGELGAKLQSLSKPIDYTRLVQAYIVAVGQQEADIGLPALCEFFRRLKPEHLNNGYSSAKFYSRFHLNITEELILAVVSDDFALGPAGRRWLEEDEMLVRRRIHKDMRVHLEKSGL